MDSLGPHGQAELVMDCPRAATDRQMDQLVYQLYDLTHEEIKIVEEATQ